MLARKAAVTFDLLCENHPQVSDVLDDSCDGSLGMTDGTSIADALKKLFNVEVEKVRTSIRKGKTRRVGRRVAYGKTVKKAIVTLKEGYSVNTGLGAENATMHNDQVQK